MAAIRFRFRRKKLMIIRGSGVYTCLINRKKSRAAARKLVRWFIVLYTGFVKDNRIRNFFLSSRNEHIHAGILARDKRCHCFKWYTSFCSRLGRDFLRVIATSFLSKFIATVIRVIRLEKMRLRDLHLAITGCFVMVKLVLSSLFTLSMQTLRFSTRTRFEVFLITSRTFCSKLSKDFVHERKILREHRGIDRNDFNFCLLLNICSWVFPYR